MFMQKKKRNDSVYSCHGDLNSVFQLFYPPHLFMMIIMNGIKYGIILIIGVEEDMFFSKERSFVICHPE